jgi:glycosyltransferase involved in cell wall biosynthesis
MPPRVTVVMPVYNGEKYIAEAVGSVLASRYADFELLVVDDGSTDASIAEATRAAAGDTRLRVVPMSHGGVAAARDAALREARGEFVANLDADDAMFPERLGRQVAFLDRHPDHVAVGARVLVVDALGRPQRVVVRYFTHEEIDAAHLSGLGGAIGNPAAMFRRQAALAVGGFPPTAHATGEDHDFWLRLAEVGRLANLPDVLIRYRIHGANASTGEGKTERRLAVTLDNLRRAFERRGITDREPTKAAAPPLRAAERWCDLALCRHFAGDRVGALWRVAVALALNPAAPATRSAVTRILGRT